MCDFLPASVHAVLNDVEASLSLPVLVLVILCTLQYIAYHGMHIACTVKEIMRKRSEKKRRQRKCVKTKPGPGLIQRATDFVNKLMGRTRAKCLEKRKPCCKKPRPPCKRSSCGGMDAEQKAIIEDDWDDMNDDDDDDLDDL